MTVNRATSDTQAATKRRMKSQCFRPVIIVPSFDRNAILSLALPRQTPPTCFSRTRESNQAGSCLAIPSQVLATLVTVAKETRNGHTSETWGVLYTRPALCEEHLFPQTDTLSSCNIRKTTYIAPRNRRSSLLVKEGLKSN